MYCPMWLWSWTDNASPVLDKTLCIISNSSVNSSRCHSVETSIRVKICDILCHVTLKLDVSLKKPIGHFYATSSYVYHFKTIGEFKLELYFGNAQIGGNLGRWPLALTSCMGNVNGDTFWKFHDDTMAGTLWKLCDRQADSQMDGWTGRCTDRLKCL